MIWDGCPVQPLGVQGDTSYYLDRLGQLRAVKKHEVDTIRNLFGGDVQALARHFPQFDKDGSPRLGKFDQATAAAAMNAASFEKGLWHPEGSLRGPGAWVDDDGGLIYHAGDAVLMGGVWHAPGLHAGRVFPAERAIPRPAPVPDATAAMHALEMLGSWSFRRPGIDPVLALGLACAQMLGGALSWRPVGWLTGDAATGKSTFQELLLLLHGGEAGLLQASDATEAGIRSVLGHSTLPVAVDELEPDTDRPQKVKAVVELARRAASGGVIFRGGADQKGHQSQARSAFLFSSILVPPMPAQDRSRLILLDLERLPAGAPKLTLHPPEWRRIGAQIKAALVQAWPLWPQRLEIWRSALALHGQTGRGADNYATVLAMADAALHPLSLPDADAQEKWATELAHSATEDAMEVGSNADDMLTWLLTQTLDPWRKGLRYTVAQWVQCAAKLPGGPEQIEAVPASGINQYLAPFGLRVRGDGVTADLCIANKPLQGLCDLFEGSMWQGGVWSQAARRIEGSEYVALTMSGVKTRGVAVPLRAMPGLFAFPPQSARHPAPHGSPEYSQEDLA
ncbi:hypothetical protein [Pararhodobacter sp.]|uniref:hypothetical protein n=1 Tax=Pararhodobacter sp. TaxID=2127056 RepID=UPI002FDE84CA